MDAISSSAGWVADKLVAYSSYSPLGLADVVQSYSGGIQMDTMFVDEGFGSLDSEALELALNTLIDLQKGGRMVGVISHVAGLKERMDVQLVVESGPEGSSASFRLP